MLRLALSSVLANRVRLALTALAVVLGVSFVAGTFVLTDSIDAAFDRLLTDANEGVDAYVTAADEDPLSSDPFVSAPAPTFDEGVLDAVRGVDGVAGAAGAVEGTARLVATDADGEARVLGGQGPPQLGLTWNDLDGAITLRDGRPPVAADEVVVDAASIRDAGWEVGDLVTVVTDAGTREFELVGVAGFGEEDNLLGATLALFTLDTAQELFDRGGRLEQVAVVAEEGVSPEQVVQRLAAALDGADVEVVSAADQQQAQQQEITAGLGFLDAILLGFAGVSLFVGAFLIVNTFSIIVAQRTREFALLRAVGASAAQVRGVVVLEALVVGLVGGTVGLATGVGLGQLLRIGFGALGIDFPDGGLVVAPRTVVASYAVSVLVTLVAAVLPARRAASVAPVEALRGTGRLDAARIGGTRTVGGVLLGLAGGLLLFLGLTGVGDQEVVLVGAGAALTFLGVALLAPWLARPVVAVLGVGLGRSVTARLARGNAARNPGRTSATASALMVGVALVTFVSIVASSVSASVAVLFEEQFSADLTVTDAGGFGTLPVDPVPLLADVEGVASVSAERFVPARVDGVAVQLVVVDAATIGDHYDLQPSAGALAALDRGGLVLLDEVATTQGLVVGDLVEVDLVEAPGTMLELVGTFASSDALGSPYLLDRDTATAAGASVGAPVFASVLFDVDADREAVRADVETTLAAVPGVAVQDVGEVLAQTEETIGLLLNIMIALLALALLIAVVGIVNTLALSVLERTRELGLLRAVGMQRRQVRAAVRMEAVLVSLFGALLGVLVGSAFGWALVTALAGEGLGVLVVPGGRLVVYLVAAAAAGVGAAVLPARRAARLDVLAAVGAD